MRASLVFLFFLFSSGVFAQEASDSLKAELGMITKSRLLLAEKIQQLEKSIEEKEILISMVTDKFNSVLVSLDSLTYDINNLKKKTGRSAADEKKLKSLTQLQEKMQKETLSCMEDVETVKEKQNEYRSILLESKQLLADLDKRIAELQQSR